MKGFEITDEHRYAATILLTHVIKGELRVSYGEIAKEIGSKYNIEINPHFGLSHIIGQISQICHELNLPLLSMVVINDGTQLPGPGFYKLYDELNDTNFAGNKYHEDKIRSEIKESIQKCKEWYKLTDYLGIEVEGINKPVSDTKEEQEEEEKLSEFYEGELKEHKILSKDRDPQIVKDVKKRDNYTCQGCSFKYENKIVQAHHLVPISEKDAGLVRTDELITLCPTCHALAHELLKTDKSYQDKSNLISKLQEIVLKNK